MNTFWTVLVILITGVLGFLVGKAEADSKMVCPYGYTEDSCSVQFIGRGEWTLIEGE